MNKGANGASTIDKFLIFAGAQLIVNFDAQYIIQNPDSIKYLVTKMSKVVILRSIFIVYIHLYIFVDYSTKELVCLLAQFFAYLFPCF